MHTRWSITVFLFFGILSAGLLLLPAICRLFGINTASRPYRVSNMAAALSAAAAVAAVALSLNAPANLINILGKPAAGLSSAIIAQLVVLVAALFCFFKGAPDKRGLDYFSAAVAVYAVFCLFRIYMISTRPALNTPVLLIVLLLTTLALSMLVAAMLPARDGNQEKFPLFLLGVSTSCGIGQLAFCLRLLFLPKEDRILSFTQLTTGSYATLFWISLILLALVPALQSAYRYKKQRSLFPSTVLGLYLIGLFAFCGLVNQMPAIVHSRILY